MLPNTIENEPLNASLVQACIVERGLVNPKDINLSLSDKLSLRTGDLFTRGVVRQALRRENKVIHTQIFASVEIDPSSRTRCWNPMLSNNSSVRARSPSAWPRKTFVSRLSIMRALTPQRAIQ